MPGSLLTLLNLFPEGGLRHMQAKMKCPKHAIFLVPEVSFIYCFTLSTKIYVPLLITANCITVTFDARIAELKNVTVKF